MHMPLTTAASGSRVVPYHPVWYADGAAYRAVCNLSIPGTALAAQVWFALICFKTFYMRSFIVLLVQMLLVQSLLKKAGGLAGLSGQQLSLQLRRALLQPFMWRSWQALGTLC